MLLNLGKNPTKSEIKQIGKTLKYRTLISYMKILLYSCKFYIH